MLLTVCAVWAITPAQSTTEPWQMNMPSNGSRSGPLPPTIWGFTYAVDGVTPLNGCTVAITEEATGEVVVWDETRQDWDPNMNAYVIWMGEFLEGWAYGDVVKVTATKGAQIGWNEAPIPSDYGVEIDVTLNAEMFIMDLVTGWNLVSLPLVGFGYKASTLGLNPGDTVSEWNSTTKTYRNHIIGVPVNDFTIKPGSGYEINVPSGTRTLELCGTIPTASQSKTITVPAGGGWAMVGFVGQNSTRHASDVPAMYSVAGGVTTVSTWNPLMKTYSNWLSVIPTINNFILTPGLAYWILASTSGTLSYEPAVPPVASFTYAVDGLTVNVDASSSSGYGIISYTWDWGDESPPEVYTTPTASHKYGSYVPALTTSMKSRQLWLLFGLVYLPDGVTPVVGATVTVTNLRSGYSETLTSDDQGYYATGLVETPGGPPDSGGPMQGDIANVTAVFDTMIGWNEVVVDYGQAYQWLDVTLSGLRPGYWVTLTVMDVLGQTDTVTQLVVLPMGTPTLTSPANGATGVPLTSTLTWIASEGTNYNEIYIGSGGWSAIDHSNTSSIVFKLDPSHTWSWRVRSSFDGGLTYGDWSATWTFKTVS
jgi:hypothetical protein